MWRLLKQRKTFWLTHLALRNLRLLLAQWLLCSVVDDHNYMCGPTAQRDYLDRFSVAFDAIDTFRKHYYEKEVRKC